MFHLTNKEMKTHIKFTILLLMIVILNVQQMIAQEVEVIGKFKVSTMDTLNNEKLLVVKQADGTLGTRQLSSLPPPIPDTIRSLGTDFELAKHLCSCNNAMPPFLIESVLGAGYTLGNLLSAGVSIPDLIAGGVSYADLFSAGVTIADILEAGESPLNLFFGNIPIDSLIGKIFEGGIVFYLDTLGIHPSFNGLLAATSDQGGFEKWGCSGTNMTNVPDVTNSPPTGPGAEIGDGGSNTLGIVSDACQVEEPLVSAAELCDNYSGGGETDWFLPSEGELNQLYLNLHLANLGNFSNSNYWSSTEFGSSTAWYQNFSSGFQSGTLGKGSTMSIRPIRSF